jgi:hypothetical protein
MYALDPTTNLLPQPRLRPVARSARSVAAPAAAPRARVQARPAQAASVAPRASAATHVRSRANSVLVSQVMRETVVKLTVNSLLLVVAGTTLARLVPTHFVNQAQIQEVDQEVSFTKARVDQLRQDFNQSFDPSQARVLMVEQTYKVDPSQRQVVWSDAEAVEVPRQVAALPDAPQSVAAQSVAAQAVAAQSVAAQP